ncbi:DUF397 domain-containing protein [Actinophytocola gossypii]|uniref:DUF397 domain-containing protein n=1 Tax=Actinophytocola gossypii TaxID=2812003 RepID=A0ABT2J469_9PSEU|nr:DUF397 domain-containing protein [Actinophytocola gossypii]MCT2582660.1 DUF397 domain-containing protein [Actinophytocola gossypii]
MEGTGHYVITWRKSSFSESHGGDCVEVGVAWRKSSFSEPNGGNCVEVGPTADAILVRDTKNRSAGTLTFAATAWQALTATLADQPR